jgi:hypothetical protein
MKTFDNIRHKEEKEDKRFDRRTLDLPEAQQVPAEQSTRAWPGDSADSTSHLFWRLRTNSGPAQPYQYVLGPSERVIVVQESPEVEIDGPGEVSVTFGAVIKPERRADALTSLGALPLPSSGTAGGGCRRQSHSAPTMWALLGNTWTPSSDTFVITITPER